MKRLVCLVVCLVAVATPAAPAQNKRPLKVEDLFAFQRVADPQIHPDGKTVAYVVSVVDLPNNRSASHLWLAAADGSWRRQLTTALGKKDRAPRWSPDGKYLLFESNRSGDNQLWVLDMVNNGEARPLTNIATGAATGTWSPDGKRVAFVSAVWPEYSHKPFPESNEANHKRAEEIEKSPVKAKTFTKLFYRHWDEYVEDKRQHLFVVPFEPARSASEGFAEPRDVTPGDRDAYPTSTTFSVGDEFVFSPDGKYLVYTAPPQRDEAWSTNYDIWRVPVTGGKAENLTAKNPAADGSPRFSLDGKHLAYRAQKRAGCEADKWDILLVECDPSGALKGPPRPLTADADVSVDEFVWWDEDKLLFAADAKAEHVLFLTYLRRPNGGPYTATYFTRAEGVGTLGSLSVSPRTRTLAFTQARLNQPNEVCTAAGQGGDGGPRNISRANDALLAALDLPRPESVNVAGADGTPMQMWILKPPGFDPKKKWPLVYLVHGGPQGAWGDGWSYRWNPMLWAAQGYVVALPNPRGSTGFGQKYVDEISGDWGGKCYIDLMKGLDYLEKLPYIDKDRMAAAGASFGGYMMNWFAVNTNRFKCLITHCSVWNFESMYATTDELWFDEWEHGGPPWGKDRHAYEKHSPHRYAANLAKFKTPMLVIHNDLDFRCPIGQGHELFGSLQRQGVPSRMINFPDEGHWVLKPKNSEHWHKEVFGWLTKYAAPGGR